MTVLELRQYTLHPGRRDDLIDLFERQFVEGQEAAGMTLIGQFRDLDHPDRFVWLRAFPDMDARLRSLETFYAGPTWRAHRDAANATMIDSDDVLLLRPLDFASGFRLGDRGPPGASGPGPGAVVAGVLRLAGPEDDPPARFRTEVAPRLVAAGLTPAAVLVTDPSPNTFPGLPVREGERVLAWFAALPDQAAADAALAAARSDEGLSPLFAAALQILRLQPTARSRLHG
jgi:hypothetical protein